MPCLLSGIIDSVDNSGTDGNKISFNGGDYRFDIMTTPTSSFPR